MKRLRTTFQSFLLVAGFSQKNIEAIYIGIYWKWKQMKKPCAKIKNFYLFKKGRRTLLEYTLRKKLLAGNEIFWDNNFYQSYPPLSFHWERDSLLRVKNFKLEKYLHPNHILLDIGGNLWFFSLYISHMVQHIDVIEYSQTLVEIWNILKEHEKIKNVSINQWDFTDFESQKKYDIILSFAVHKWINMSFEDYITKLLSLLQSDGIIFLESQNLEIDPFEEHLMKVQDLLEIIEMIDIHEPGGYARKWAICKQKYI